MIDLPDAESDSDADESVHTHVPNIPDVLKSLVPEMDMPAGSDVIVVVNPYTGQRNLTSVLHILLQTHFVGRNLPAVLKNCIGQRFCEDPRQSQAEHLVLAPRESTVLMQKSTRDPMYQQGSREASLMESAPVKDMTTLPAGYLSLRAAIQPLYGSVFELRMCTCTTSMSS